MLSRSREEDAVPEGPLAVVAGVVGGVIVGSDDRGRDGIAASEFPAF
jgi:hypothetical protein